MASKAKRREKWGTIIYWVLLLLYTAAIFSAIFWFLNDRWKYAAEYEKAQPGGVIDAYMSTLNAERWNRTMQSAAARLANDFQTADQCADVVRSKLTGEFKKKSIATEDLNTMAYEIICDGRAVGKVFMEIDHSAVTEYGQKPWKITGDEFNFDYLLTSASATAPATYMVKFNDVAATEKYITKSGIHYDVLEQYYEDYDGLPTKVTYEVNNLVGKVEPVVYNESGEVFTYDDSLNDSQYMNPCSSEELMQFSGFVDGIINPYVQYFGTKYGNQYYAELMNYVLKGSELNNTMIGFEDGRSWQHTYRIDLNRYQFKNAFVLGGGFYVVEVEYETTAYADYKTVNETVTTKFVVVKNGSGIRTVAVA